MKARFFESRVFFQGNALIKTPKKRNFRIPCWILGLLVIHNGEFIPAAEHRFPRNLGLGKFGVSQTRLSQKRPGEFRSSGKWHREDAEIPQIDIPADCAGQLPNAIRLAGQRTLSPALLRLLYSIVKVVRLPILLIQMRQNAAAAFCIHTRR